MNETLTKEISMKYNQGNSTGVYATNIVVQHSEQEFIISFYEAQPPILLGTKAEIKAKIEAIEYIEANCVARVIVHPDRMPNFIQALQNNLNMHIEQITQEETADGQDESS